MVTELLGLATRSRVYDLAHPLEAGMPVHPSHPPFFMTLHQRFGDNVRTDGGSGANEVIIMSGHHSTHIDALGHMSCSGELHGGTRVQDAINGSKGLRVHSAADIPIFFNRGLMLDIQALRSRPLEAAEAVTADDVEQALGKSGLTIEPGDAVLIRTGWSRHWHDPKVFSGNERGAPGPDMNAARLIADRGAVVIGADTMTCERFDPATGELPIHNLCLVERGIHLLEMLNLEPLAEAGVSEFMFVASPLKIVGATGSPVRPFALVLP